MQSCVIFGGSGYIGTRLAARFIETGRFNQIHIIDLKPSSLEKYDSIVYHNADVRKALPVSLNTINPEWIFNLAAVHREPGHEPLEYFETNLKGARNICAYADTTGCRNILFTSSISVYGPTDGPTDESAPICPVSPYGGSKYPAEIIHECWLAKDLGRKLIIVRPGVVYGPGDPGNILRMIRAVKKGYFAYPGSMHIKKSYAYIFGLLDSIEFLMDSNEKLIRYNYAEHPTQSMNELVRSVKQFTGSVAPVLSIPTPVLLPVSHLVKVISGGKSSVHPVRVRKAGMSTHVVPGYLIAKGFKFKYSFEQSLEHWKSIKPDDFE